MKGINPPPMVGAIVDPATGVPTRVFIQFCYQMWEALQKSESTDSNGILALMRYGSEPATLASNEQVQAEQTLSSLSFVSRDAEIQNLQEQIDSLKAFILEKYNDQELRDYISGLNGMVSMVGFQ